MRFDILYEDKEIIVCNKPAGVASQDDRSFNMDMVSMIKNHLKKPNPYIGIIHRLDKPVSGVLVYAKTKKAAAFLSRQVQKNETGPTMTKRYKALVQGELPVDAPDTIHTLENHLLHDKKSNTSYVVDAPEKDSKPALLEYRCVRHKESEDGTLSELDINLITGRHHQIRVQMAHMGYPIVGDRRYSSSASRRLELCAYSLTFTHPNGKVMTFKI